MSQSNGSKSLSPTAKKKNVSTTIGLIVDSPDKLLDSVNEALQKSFSYIACKLFQPRTQQPFADIMMTGSTWSYRIIPIMDGLEKLVDISSQGSLGSPKFASLMKYLQKQLEYMQYVKVFGVLFDVPANPQVNSHIARLVNGHLANQFSATTINLCFDVGNREPGGRGFSGYPFIQESYDDDIEENSISRQSSIDDSPWNQWNNLRFMLKSDRRVSLALRVKADLPETEVQERWSGEPVGFLVLPTSIFQENSQGFPVLSKAHQKFLSKIIFKNPRCCVIIEGHARVKTHTEYVQYIEHAVLSQVSKLRETNYLIEGTEDGLQVPLQPLRDNLEAATYEIFEKDPVKYSVYRDAIRQAIQDRIDNTDLVIMVVGAGRGPLVTCCITAAESVKKKVTIFVVEKNPNAIATLNAWKETSWSKSKVLQDLSIFEADMRTFTAPKKVDIVVSELLGSFSDNELSPECLDGVFNSVKDDSISIPESYTSFLRPIMSQKLFNECNAFVTYKSGMSDTRKVFETSYVVNIHNYYSPWTAQPLFTFEHKEGELKKHPKERSNDRFKVLSFENNPLDIVVHGFAGYFETVLYKDFKLSINPETFSQGMFSWFPIFFPLQNPIEVPVNTRVTVQFWRVVTETAVWYEWSVVHPVVTGISNSNGRSEKMLH